MLEELPLKRNTHLTPLIEELHAVLKENSANDAAYKRYFDSLKASVLTAFYTPPQVTEAIVRILHDQGIQPQNSSNPVPVSGLLSMRFIVRILMWRQHALRKTP